MGLLDKMKKMSSISLKEKLFFAQNLQVMTKTSIPLNRTLSTLAEQTTNARFKDVINDLRETTEKGTTLSEAMAKYPNVFDQVFVKMIEAGEVSGKLEEVLEQVYLQLKKTHELRAKVKGALMYPMVVVVAMGGIGIAMMIFVVPQITSMFAEYKTELPIVTRVIIAASNFMAQQWWLMLILIGGFITACVYLWKLKPIKKVGHKVMLHLPVIGPIIKKINLARLTRTFSSLIKTSIPIERTLNVTAGTIKNYWYKLALEESATAVTKGASLTEIFKKYPNLFPPLLIQMTSAGEESGSVDELLSQLAEFYETEVDETMKILPSLLEPILILGIGAAVATMAVAILMPMYTITQHI